MLAWTYNAEKWVVKSCLAALWAYFDMISKHTGRWILHNYGILQHCCVPVASCKYFYFRNSGFNRAGGLSIAVYTELWWFASAWLTAAQVHPFPCQNGFSVPTVPILTLRLWAKLSHLKSPFTEPPATKLLWKNVISWLFCFFYATVPQWARAPSFTRFLDHTQRR
jgi:hypothetical protein